MKNISLFLLLLVILFISGCSKIRTTDSAKEFCEYIYDISRGEIKRGAVIDLRDLETDYAQGHIYGALSYNFKNQEESHFITWITGLKSTDTYILLIDSGNNEHQVIMTYLEKAGYKKVLAYTQGYNTLKETTEFKQKVEVNTGTDDCGC
jgi:rhodanese-related sulfurtransferase